MHIQKLPNELLLEIFDCYRITLNGHENPTNILTQDGWFPLAQVCQRWRQVTLGSLSRLRLCLYVRQLERAGSILPHFHPTLPLILGLNDEAAISDVVPLLHRTCAVTLTASRAEFMHQILPHVASLLKTLQIVARGDNGPPVAVPGKLLSGANAPHLRALILGYVLDIRSLNTITSSTITSLLLKEIPDLLPEDVCSMLRGVPQLKCLDIAMNEMPGNGEVGDAEPVPLPCLESLAFSGPIQWLLDFVKGITATTIVDLTVVIEDDPEELEGDQDAPEISRLMAGPVEGPADFTSVAKVDLKAAEFFCGTAIDDNYEREARVSFPVAESPNDTLWAMTMAAAMIEDTVASVHTLELMGRLPEPMLDEDFNLQQWREEQCSLWHNLIDFFPQVDKIVMPYADAPAILGMLCRYDEEAQREAEPALLVPLLREVTIVKQSNAPGEELGPLIASLIDRRRSLTHQKVEVGFKEVDDEDMFVKSWLSSETLLLLQQY
ncbi:hypothetical protein BC834DRAFT_972755 [Gloeopeniophorella convolvens]|nr:hypothetical protein BC834DRAFT_972755 [Gloeopeniophorella convolvens]